MNVLRRLRQKKREFNYFPFTTMFKENRFCEKYRRATGHVTKMNVVCDGTGTAVEAGDLVEMDGENNRCDAWVAGQPVFAIALQPSTAATTNIEVDMLLPGDAMFADVDTGTPAKDDFSMIDGDSNGVNIAGTSTDDFIYFYSGSTTEVLVYPNHYLIGGNDDGTP